MTTVSFEVPETITVTVKGLGAYTVEVATIHADFLPFLFVRGVTRYVGGEGAAVASKDDDGNARDAADVLIDKKNKVTMYLAALVSGKLPRPGGAIGEENLASLVVRVWRLDRLNDRYEEWLREYKRSDKLDQWLVTSYLTILRDDPQLPFSLLPKWWKGDRAWRLVAPKIKEMYFALRPQR